MQSDGVDHHERPHAQHTSTAHGAHTDHAAQFRDRFWWCLLLSAPVVAFSAMFADLIGYTRPPGTGWISPLFGTIVFFLLRQTLADLGTIYLLMLGIVAIVVMLRAPKGIWGLIVERFGWEVFPLERRVVIDDRNGLPATPGRK